MTESLLTDQIQALIFDCDGTLTDSMPVHYQAWRATLDRYGVPFGLEQFYALAGMPSNRIIAQLGDEHGKPLDAETIAQEKEEAFLELLPSVLPVEKVVALARAQQGERPMAVASGGFRWVIDRQLSHLGIGDCFQAIVTAEDTKLHKPHPDVFLEAARQMGVEPAACLVFEDADLGVEAAQRAGMGCVDVRGDDWGSSSV